MLDDIFNMLNEGVDPVTDDTSLDSVNECSDGGECPTCHCDPCQCGGGLSEEDPENDAMIAEAFLIESLGTGALMEQFLNEDAANFVKLGVLSEKSIVRLDKYAKLSRAESQAVFAIAKEHNDRDYRKLVTIWKMRKILISKLEKKYANQARQRAKQMVKKSKQVKGKTSSKL